MANSKARQFFTGAFKVTALLVTSFALAAQSDTKSANSVFPSREAICAPIYGVSESGSVPYCSARFGQCLKTEGAAIDRLSSSWMTTPKKIRQKCQSEARSRRAAIYQAYPAVLALARDQGYQDSYSVAAVEACVAANRKLPPPPKMDALPASCVATGAIGLPPEEVRTPEEQCTSAKSFTDPEAYPACVKLQRSAKSGITRIQARLTANIVSSCTRLITSKGFDGNALPYRSSSFLTCATKAIKYGGLTD